MRILWTHNFPPRIISAGIFMNLLLEEMHRRGLHIDLHYTGDLKSPLAVIRAAARIRKLSENYDITHAQFGSACGLATSAAKGRTILTLRGTDFYGVRSGRFHRRVHGILCRRMTSQAIGRFDRVVVVSQRMRGDVQRVYPDARVDVLPSGVDLESFRSRARTEARRQLGFAEHDSPWILTASVTTNSPVKRVWLAEAAVEELRRRIGPVELKVATGIPHDEMPVWINASDLVLLTSTHEGWPNIVKEGLACNVPFVTTDVSDLPGIAAEEPSCFIADASPAALADAMQLSLASRDESNLRRHVEEMSLAKIGRGLESVYASLFETAPAECRDLPDVSDLSLAPPETEPIFATGR